MYRTNAPLTGRRATVVRNGKSHTVELLGDGQQYVLFGRHHGGARARYTWSRLWRPEELTRITEADVERFFETLEEQLGAEFSVYLSAVRRPVAPSDGSDESITQAPFFAESGTSPPRDTESTEASRDSRKEGSDV